MSFLQLLDPFFLAHRALRREIARMASESVGTVVDVGCGITPYRDFFSHTTYIGIETTRSSDLGSAKAGADVLYDGKHLPLADGSIDNVLCNQVLEHVFEPTEFLSELNRILRPGGKLMMTTPFVWDEHEQPYDYARYSFFGLCYLAKKCGFEVTDARRTLGNASILVQLSLSYWFKVVRRNGQSSLLGKLFIAALSLPANIIGLLFATILPSNPDFYLDNAITLIRLPKNTPQ